MTFPLRPRMPATDRTPDRKEPAMPAFPEIAFLLAFFGNLRDRVIRHGDDPERGDVMQWVLITAIGVTLAVAVGAILIAKITAKANSITTTTP